MRKFKSGKNGTRWGRDYLFCYVSDTEQYFLYADGRKERYISCYKLGDIENFLNNGFWEEVFDADIKEGMTVCVKTWDRNGTDHSFEGELFLVEKVILPFVYVQNPYNINRLMPIDTRKTDLILVDRANYKDILDVIQREKVSELTKAKEEICRLSKENNRLEAALKDIGNIAAKAPTIRRFAHVSHKWDYVVQYEKINGQWVSYLLWSDGKTKEWIKGIEFAEEAVREGKWKELF